MTNKKFYELYPNLAECVIQTYTDDLSKKGDKNWKDPQAKIYPFSRETLKRLYVANKNGDLGVYFSVNSMEGGERSKKNTKNINTRICEIDNCSKEEQIKKIANCPIKPSMIIESKKSYHLYRFATGATIENYHIISKGLIAYFDGDNKLGTDYARVLRLPGFYHNKDPNDKFLCNVIHLEESYYTEQQMMEAYPREPPKPPERKVSKVDGDDFREVVNSRSAEGMLSRVSGTRLVSGENITFRPNSNGTKQIICDSRATGCWIDRNDRIGSSDKGGPSWTNWVTWYGLYDWSELYTRIIENCQDLLPDNLKKPKQPQKPKVNLVFEDLGFLYPDGPFNEKFGGLKSKELVMISAGPNQGKTSFVLQLLKKNKELGKNVALINMQFDLHDTYRHEFFRAKGYKDHELKLIGTDLKPIDEQTKKRLDAYIERRENEVRILNMEQGTSSEQVIQKLAELVDEGYSMIAIDALSDIGEVANELRAQNNIIKEFRNFVNQSGIVLILIHHFNKAGSDYSGTGKFRDNANATIEIYPKLDKNGEYCRKFVLSKDKPHSNPVHCYCYYELGSYTEVPHYLVNED